MDFDATGHRSNNVAGNSEMNWMAFGPSAFDQSAEQPAQNPSFPHRGRPIHGRHLNQDTSGRTGQQFMPRNQITTRPAEARKSECPFCKQNGEAASVYTSHNLKDASSKVTCPVLMKYRCPICKATGSEAHTESYCPMRPIGGSLVPRLKRTPRNATGLRNKKKYK